MEIVEQPQQAVPLDNPILLPRQQLCNRVRDALCKHSCVRVCSPPGTGKSSLIQLIIRDLIEEGIKCAYIPCAGFNAARETAFAYVQRELQFRYGVPEWGTVISSRMCLFFDDAHTLYYDSTFLTNLIKGSSIHIVLCRMGQCSLSQLQPKGIFIWVLFSTKAYHSLVQFGYSDFRLLPEEEDSLISQIVNLPQYQQHHSWLPQFAQVMRLEAPGHIGIIRCFLQFIISCFDQDKKIPSLDEVLQFYHGRFTSQIVWDRFFRLPPASELSQTHKQILKEALSARVSPPPDVIASHEPPDIFAKRQLIRMVVLVVDNNALVFATPLHRRFFCRAIFPSSSLRSSLDRKV